MANKAFDASLTTNWQAASGSMYAGQWLEVDFGIDSTFSQVTLSEYGNRTSGYRIEYLTGLVWRTAYSGTTIGASRTVTFPAVTGRKARIYFTSGSFTPIIYEFQIDNRAAPSINLALNKSYLASSQWDSGQIADKAFDGSGSSDWQAANGQGFAGQWLEVDFGVQTTFNSVHISEFGNRTSGYRLEYWLGGQWVTAFFGNAIGPDRTIQFPAVTGTKARIYFTSGSYTPIIYEMSFSSSSPGQNLALGQSYQASSSWNGYQIADKAFDSDVTTNWQAGYGTGFSGQWLSVQFGNLTTLNTIQISEYGNRTAGYRIEYWDNAKFLWVPVYTGTVIGASTTVSLPLVTTTAIRLYFTAGIYTPIIYEVGLFLY